MHGKTHDDVLPFRVALMLKNYKFGSNMVAKFLGKPRGLVQSWMQAGEAHTLAQKQFRLDAFEKKLKGIRRKVTEENIYYLLAMKLLEHELTPEYIGNFLGIPLSTIRSWKRGVAPKGVKKLFIERAILDREFKKTMRFLREKSTKENLFYYLSLRLSEAGKQEGGRRRVGGKTIGEIISEHYKLFTPIPKETISCWIDGRRTPKNTFPQLMDKEIIEEEYNKIVEELTRSHIDYHIAKNLYDRYHWKYSKISKVLNIDKEKVRGWVTKNRGSPVAKTFFNQDIIDEALSNYVQETSFNGGEPEEKTQSSVEEGKEERLQEAIYEELDLKLEDEVIYHLSYFPNGLSSPEAIKSILIENKEATVEDIIDVLDRSRRIVKKGNRWFLRD